MSEGLLAAENVGVRLEGRSILDGVSATLRRGQVYGLIGHNGSGKSTLLKVLAGQIAATSGVARFEGRSLGEWGRRAFSRKVAYLSQNPPAATGLTVRELVGLGRYPWHGPLGRFGAQDRAAVETALAAAEVQDFAERLVETLSGGERQRAWIASLVAQETVCLLLDEPTSALDIGHQLQVLELVRRLAADGRCVVIVLHDVNMAARFCDELIALHSGRLIRRGTRDAIMTSEVLRNIYGVDMAVVPHPTDGHPVGIAL